MLRRLFSKTKPKVFGLGLSKTGTTTLSACLRHLGYRHTSYNPALLSAWSEGRHDEIWSIIDRYDSFEDWPYPLMAHEIMERYEHGAFYILTVRKDATTWLESLKKHAMRQPPDRAVQRRIAYGLDYPALDERAMLDHYERHNSGVIQTAQRLGLSERLQVLCWENGDGWGDLCTFLGRSVPNKAFPHENKATPPSAEVWAENNRIFEQLKLAALPSNDDPRRLQ